MSIKSAGMYTINASHESNRLDHAPHVPGFTIVRLNQIKSHLSESGSSHGNMDASKAPPVVLCHEQQQQQFQQPSLRYRRGGCLHYNGTPQAQYVNLVARHCSPRTVCLYNNMAGVSYGCVYN